MRVAKLWQTTPEYRAYAEAQMVKTSKLADYRSGRIIHLVDLLAKHHKLAGREVLCIGCRNEHELQRLEYAGFKPTGIDLVSHHERVIPMDFHLMDFHDKSFDAVFASHSLEHSWNHQVALREWARVTKPRGTWVIEVPVQYEVTKVDRQDFGSVLGLWAWVSAHKDDILYAEITPLQDPKAVRLVCR